MTAEMSVHNRPLKYGIDNLINKFEQTLTEQQTTLSGVVRDRICALMLVKSS